MARFWIMNKSAFLGEKYKLALCSPRLITNTKYNNILNGLVGNYTTQCIYNFMRKHTSMDASITITNNNVTYTKIYNNSPHSYYYIFMLNQYDTQEIIDRKLFWDSINNENKTYIENINIGIDVYNFDTSEQVGFCYNTFDMNISSRV